MHSVAVLRLFDKQGSLRVLDSGLGKRFMRFFYRAPKKLYRIGFEVCFSIITKEINS